MQLFNGGARKIILKDQVVEPKTLFEVTDEEGKKLMALYSEEVTKPPVAEKVVSKNEIKKLEAQIKEFETQLADFDAIKAERDELSKKVDKLEAQIEKLNKK